MQPLGGEDVGQIALKDRGSTVQQAPTWSASVDRLSGTPSLA